jgi:cystathionine gamma-synthase
MQLSTTFRRPGVRSEVGKSLQDLGEGGLDWQDPPVHVYSRYTTETRGRAEKVLSGVLEAHALTYASGLTAAYAAILHYSPKVIAIRKGYHGVHAGIETYQRSHDDVKVIDLDDEYPQLTTKMRGDAVNRGLLVWVESPLNPTGEARDIQHYADRAHKVGGCVIVDSTFAPLQGTFEHGADMVMHSATKYFGGHSDLLAGVLAVKSKAQWTQLFDDRCNIGGMPGNFEAWLLLRSLRTLQVRWRQQSTTALKLANWLQSLVAGASSQSEDHEDQDIIQKEIVSRVWHASFQPRNDLDPAKEPRFNEGKDFDPSAQLKNGWPATFAIRVSVFSGAEGSVFSLCVG